MWTYQIKINVIFKIVLSYLLVLLSWLIVINSKHRTIPQINFFNSLTVL